MYFNQIYATSIGFSEVEKGWLFGVIRLINVMIIVRLIEKNRVLTGVKVFLYYPLLIVVAGIPAIVGGKELGAGLLWLMTVANTSRYVALDKYVNREFDSKVRATAMSSLSFLVSLGYAILLFLGGGIMKNSGVGMYYLAVGVVGLAALWPLGRKIVEDEGNEDIADRNGIASPSTSSGSRQWTGAAQ